MYPHLRSLGRQEDEEEERRILYVAMTRAKDELILTRSLRWGNTRRSPYSASVTPDRQREAYFFRELDDDLVDSDYIYPEFDDFTDFDFIVPRRN